jgi:Flp pilus assembly protein TadG
MHRAIRRAAQDERGASAVEFAIVCSILFLVLFGIVQFGIAFHRDQGIEAAAREGARKASVGATYQEVRDRVREAQSLFQGADVAVEVKANGTSVTSLTARPCEIAGLGNPVTVTAKVAPPAGDPNRYAIMIPFWGSKPITYLATGTFRCEQNGVT